MKTNTPMPMMVHIRQAVVFGGEKGEGLRITEKIEKLIAGKEGLVSGISCGANLYAAMKLAEREENKGKNIIVVLPDTGERYISTLLFHED